MGLLWSLWNISRREYLRESSHGQGDQQHWPTLLQERRKSTSLSTQRSILSQPLWSLSMAVMTFCLAWMAIFTSGFRVKQSIKKTRKKARLFQNLHLNFPVRSFVVCWVQRIHGRCSVQSLSHQAPCETQKAKRKEKRKKGGGGVPEATEFAWQNYVLTENMCPFISIKGVPLHDIVCGWLGLKHQLTN